MWKYTELQFKKKMHTEMTSLYQCAVLILSHTVIFASVVYNAPVRV